MINNRKVLLVFVETGKCRIKVLEESASGAASLQAPHDTLFLYTSGHQGSASLTASFIKASSCSQGETILPRPHLVI